MSNLKHTIEYLNNAIKELKKLEDERDVEEVRFWKKTGEGEDAEERGIKKTMRHLKDTCCEMCLNKDDGYFIEEEELDEENKFIIEKIKEM